MLGRKNGSNWSQQLISFRSSPTQFLTNTTLESFLGELLQDLQSEKLNEQIKVSMLTLFAEFPTHLCPDQKTGEHVADVLMTIFAQISDSSRIMTLKHHILVSIETLLITTDNFNLSVKSAQEFVSLLMQIIADLNDKKLGSTYRALRIMACECLRELENCYPGLLSQRLELLYSMQQQEITHAHQSYTLLYSVALKNAVQRLAQTKSTSDGSLKEVLSSNGGFSWIATENTGSLSTAEEQFLLLPSNGETKELKSILALILEDSYLLTSVSQSTLLWQLIQVVAVVRTLSPIIFKSQLVRLFGTMDVSLFHSILQMKGFFTDSLFTAEDEYVLLKRLVGMAQHPLLSTPVKLFYIDGLLHFPENRPLNSNSEENLPVLLTVKMTTSLFPTVFNDSSTMLSRQNILSLVYLENEGAEAETGIGYIMDHLLSIQKIVTEHGNREITAIFFRVVYLFVRYFNFCEKQMEDLIQTVLDVYKKNSALAPYLINLMNETQKLLDVPSWSMALSVALQKLIVDLSLNELVSQLVYHLKILARIAKEHLIPQAKTVQFLSNIAVHTDLCHLGDWRTGNAVLTVCKNLLQHQKLDVIFTELADLLQHLSLNFEDIDIQDRARFYYTLLANLSSEKLTGILSMIPAGSQTKTRSMSSIMADCENVSTHLTVHTIEQPVLHLSRVLVSNSFATFSDSTMSDMCMNDYCLKKYYERLTTSKSSSMLTLKYSLSFTENAKSQYHKLFCLVFQFELSDSNYEPVGDISVPCLFEDRKPPIMSLILKPKRPYPTELYVAAMYTTQEGLTCHSRLDPLKINFSDIFVPFPVPPTWRLEDRCQLFDELWTSFKPSESNSCAESLFCFQDRQSLREFVQLFFSRFIVSTDSDLYKIGFFLPPQFHILMQVKMLDETVHVRIATDNWKLLPYLSSYLQCITSRS